MKPGEDGVIPILTSNRVLWIDERHPESPSLAIKHGRHPDLNLQLRTLAFDDSPFVFLTSYRNSLITVHDVCGTEDGFLHIHTAPYSLSIAPTSEPKSRGEVIFRHPAEKDNMTATILRLSARGSLRCTDLELVEDDALDDVPAMKTSSTDFSPEVRELARLGSVHSDAGPLGKRNSERFDLTDVYERELAVVLLKA